MTVNRHELWDIKAYAESLGVQFRFDPMVNAGLDGSGHPISLRLPPEEIVQFDLADAKRVEAWQEFCNRFVGVRADSHYLYVCGAGLGSFHVDPYGRLGVCMISRVPDYDLRQGSFREGWCEFLPQVRYQPSTGDYLCNQCELLSLCGQCPGWAQLEHGDPEKPVEFLCRVAHLRAEAFGFSVHSEDGAA